MMFLVILVSLMVMTPVISTYLRGDDSARSILLGGRSFASRQDFFATGARCRTADLTPNEREAMHLKLAAVPTAAFEGEGARVRTINVYFHVLTSSSGDGALSDGLINQQMDVLNQDYTDSGSSFRFTLAGTDVTENDAWSTAGMGSASETELKSALRKGTYGDLNIYTTAQPDQTLGWATYPGSVGDDFSNDGVIIDYRSLPGGDFAPYNEGRTATHEVGHWMGLFHTFQDGCASDVRGGDKVRDTPAEKDANSGCPPDSTNTCPGNTGAMAGNDPIHNYMDYTDDGCMNNFTPDQVVRMRQSWIAYRGD